MSPEVPRTEYDFEQTGVGFQCAVASYVALTRSRDASQQGEKFMLKQQDQR